MPATSCWDTGSNTDPDPGSANAAGTTAEGGTSIPAPPAIWTTGTWLTGAAAAYVPDADAVGWKLDAGVANVGTPPEAEEEEIRGVC